MAYRREPAAPEIRLSEVPGWLLGPPGGFCPDDPVRNEQLREAFHAWRRNRRAWLDDHGAPFTWPELHDEQRRRAHPSLNITATPTVRRTR